MLLFVSMALLAGCGEDKGDQVNLDGICIHADTTALIALIDSSHSSARRAINDHLYRFLRAKPSISADSSQKLSASLKWLTEIYRERTGLADLSRRLGLFSEWSAREADLKLLLDSTYRNVTKEPLPLVEQIDSLLFLRVRYAGLLDSFAQANVDFEISKQLYDEGLVDSAFYYLTQAADAARVLDYLDLLGLTGLLRAKIHLLYHADYLNAEKSISHSINCFKKIDSEFYLSSALAYQGFIYQLLYQTPKAIRSFTSLLDKYLESGYVKGVSDCCYYLAEAYYDIGMLDSALFFAQKSLRQRKKLAENKDQHLPDVGFALSCLGLIEQAMGDTEIAEKRYMRARDIFREHEDPEGLHLNALRMASLYFQKDEWEKAQVQYLTVLNATDRFEESIAAAYGLSLCHYYGDTDYGEAKHILKMCIRIIESAYAKLPIPEIKTGVLSDKFGVYDLLSQIYLHGFGETGEANLVDSAFKYHEKSRANAMLDMLRAERSEVELSLEEEAIARLSSLYRMVIVGAVTDSVANEISRWEDSLLMIRLNSRPAESITDLSKHQHTSLQSLQNTIRHRESAILDYSLTPFGSAVYYVTWDTVFVSRIDISYDSLKDCLSEYGLAISSYPGSASLDSSVIAIGSLLFDKLLPTQIRKAPHIKTLHVIFSGALSPVPLETLIDEQGKFLVERFELDYHPSASIREYLSNRSRPNTGAGQVTLAAMGAPNLRVSPVGGSDQEECQSSLYAEWGIAPLQYASEEISRISALFAPEVTFVLTGDRFTESAFRKLDFGEYRLVHLATHGLTDYVKPERSAVLFSAGSDTDPENDGILRASEIRRLKMYDNVVFLSACNTGGGKSIPGEGLLSLARDFIVAGCKGVIATRWNVDDMSSAKLVRTFYKSVKEGHNSAASLADAKRTLIASEYRHPYFWAPYILIGSS